MFEYPVNLQQDGDTVLATFPDVPEAITFGGDKHEALLQARDALETALSMYVSGRRDLPNPSPAEGRPTVQPDPLECAKLGGYAAMREQGVRKAELARRLHWHTPQVDRLLDLGHASKFSQIEQAAASLGKRVEVRVV